MKLYWYGLMYGMLLSMCYTDVYASEMPKITKTQQRVSYHNLWLTPEDIASHAPKTIVLETDYAEAPFLAWGTVTTFLYWYLDQYLIYTTHTNEYSSGDSGANHLMTLWYPVNIDDDPQEEVIFFQIGVLGGFVYQENDSHWGKGWEFREVTCSLLSLDILSDPLMRTPAYKEERLSQEQKLRFLPQLMTMEDEPLIKAWIQYRLALAYLETNQQKKAEIQFTEMKNILQKLGISTIPGLTETNIPTLTEIQASGINSDIHVFNPLFLYLMGYKHNWGT